jgi:glycogen debranching enzyme
MNTNEDVSPIEDEAYQQSLALLHRCLTPAGFVASPVDVDNYARVWARDGVITGLAALASGDAALIQGMEHTLDTLATYQGPHGEVPSNVSIDGSNVSYGRLTGRVDALLWYIIGVCAYLDQTKHSSQKVRYWLSIERALFLAACWEYNNRGLIYTPISGNWADEYIQQGYVLSDQLLYELALRSAGLVFKNKDCLKKADELRQSIEVNYWPQASLLDNPLVYHPHAYAYQVEQQKQGIQHWLLSFSPVGYVTYFDGLAHALALITNIGSEVQQQQAEAYVQGLEEQIGNALVPAFWPVIQPDDADWAALQANHLYGKIKNSPYHYHNGGLWSMVAGFYAVGLARQNKRERAQHLLTAINAANSQGRENRQWEFAEYHSGQTHEPLGTPDVAWSAAAGILAHQALSQGHIPWPL